MDQQLRQQLVYEIEFELRGIKRCLEDYSPVENEREHGTLTFSSGDVDSLRIAARDLDCLQKVTNQKLGIGSTLGLAGGAACLLALGPLAGLAYLGYLGMGASVLGGGINFVSNRQLSSREKAILERVTGPLQRLCNMSSSFNILINGVATLVNLQAVARHSTRISTQQLRWLRIKLQQLRIALQHSEGRELTFVLQLGVELFEAFQSLLEMCGIKYSFIDSVLAILKFIQGLGSTTLGGLRVLVPIAAAHKLNEAENSMKMAYQAVEESKKAAEASRQLTNIRVTQQVLRTRQMTVISPRGLVVSSEAGFSGIQMSGTTRNTFQAAGELTSAGREVAKNSDDIAKAITQFKYAKHFSAGVSVLGMAMDAYTLYNVYENMNDGSRARFSHELRQIADVIEMIISLNP